MKTEKLLRIALREPKSFIKALSYLKMSEPKKIKMDDIKIIALQPNNYDDFEIFSKIITDEAITFTVPRIDRCFDGRILRQKCYHMKEKLRLVDEGDIEITMPEEVISAHKMGKSPTQIALDRFFAIPTNKVKLREIYLEMTGAAEKTGLGYYKFEDGANKLLGGGALAPISTGNPIEKVDIALHILAPKQGIGSFCLNKLLTKAFEEFHVKQVWGSSIINHPGTPTLCAKHGMMIKNHDGMKYYFIDEKMWETNKDRMKIMDDPHAASTHYGNKGDGGRS